MKIRKVQAEEVLDSKGSPTVKCRVTLSDGAVGEASAPSGASVGKYEALALPASEAIKNVAEVIGPKLKGLRADEQRKIDQLMREWDGTENKSRLGANALVSVSMAVCLAAAKSDKKEPYQYFGQLQGNSQFALPQPMILLLEGGRHGHWVTDIQEYFVLPKKEKFKSFAQRLRVGEKIWKSLEAILKKKGYATKMGLEGGFCPPLKNNEAGLQLMVEAVEKAGYKMPEQVVLGIDAAASEFFKNGQYVLKSKRATLTSREWRQKIIRWTKKYPLWSIEDPFGQEAWEEWTALTERIGQRFQVVGDDLLVTNPQRIQKAIDLKAVNSVLIKPNQIGTVTETLEAIKLADSSGLAAIISHRSGETKEWPLADLVVGTTAGQCKFGGPFKEERRAKYERLLAIERKLAKQ